MNQGERWTVYRSAHLHLTTARPVWIAKRIDGGESRPFNTWKAAFGWADHRVRERAADAMRKYNLSSGDRLKRRNH